MYFGVKIVHTQKFNVVLLVHCFIGMLVGLFIFETGKYAEWLEIDNGLVAAVKYCILQKNSQRFF